MLPERPSLLAVATIPPWPMQDGLSLRIGHLLTELARHWAIVLVAPDGPTRSGWPTGFARVPGPPVGPGATYPWRFDTTGLEQAVRSALRLRRHDRALLWPGAELLAGVAGMPPALADLIDCNALEFWRALLAADGPRDALRTVRELGFALRDGARAGRRAAAVTMVGATDAAWQRRLGRPDAVHVVPNGVELPPSDAPQSPRPTLAFTGTLDYPPNVDAALWAADAIWPRIRDHTPNARLLIAGRRPVAAVRALHGGGIEVRPDVADMGAVLAEAWIAIAPMRRGVGLKNKVLESWASARPAVMTPLARNGLALPPRHERLVVRSAAAMAAQVCALFDDAAEREALGAAARAHVVAHFTWSATAARIDTLLRCIG